MLPVIIWKVKTLITILLYIKGSSLCLSVYLADQNKSLFSLVNIILLSNKKNIIPYMFLQLMLEFIYGGRVRIEEWRGEGGMMQ